MTAPQLPPHPLEAAGWSVMVQSRLEAEPTFGDPWAAPYLSVAYPPAPDAQFIAPDGRAFRVALVEWRHDVRQLHMFCVEYPKQDAPSGGARRRVGGRTLLFWGRRATRMGLVERFALERRQHGGPRRFGRVLRAGRVFVDLDCGPTFGPRREQPT